jgi:predicted AAA+ superfamily ATPase
VYIQRVLESGIEFALDHFPVTAITGPRQCGKSTLARKISKTRDTVYLDLERPDDERKLAEPQLFLSSVKTGLICIDEIQRKPELFPLIRTLVDEWDRPGCFLILGSASQDMLRQSSESLAGRISYKRLSPFLAGELAGAGIFDPGLYMERGGFPRSILADGAEASYMWREDFITTFLERDLIQWRSFTPVTMGRLWRMLAHMNGQTINYSSLASSLGLSGTTVKTYIDLLASTYMVEIVPPWETNMKKRLVKAPKVYITDSGITACLLGLRDYRDMLGHPALGAVWEQIVLTNIKGLYPDADITHYRTAAGSEIDFVVRIGRKVFAVECKSSLSPVLSKGNYNAIEDIEPQHSFVVIPGEKCWPMKKGIDAVSLRELPAVFI